MSQNWNIGQLLSISSGYWRGCTLQAAVRLRVFSLLGQEKSSAAEIAEKASTDIRATGLLLDALTAMGLLEKEQDRYANTQFTTTYLQEDSKEYMGHIILHHHHLLDGWAQLDKAVCTGKKVERRSYGSGTERESFLLGMFNLATGLAPQIAANIDLSGRKRLLDLGGGPGTYSIQFCLKNPDLQAVIFDRPTTEPIAQKVVASFNLENRISFEAGDFTTTPLPAPPFDVAWLSHILHSNSYKQCEQCIQKTADTLEAGGLLLIHDFILTAEKNGPEFPALFALNMLVGTDEGRSYSVEEISNMMEKAGLTEIRHHTLKVPNDSSILSAIKP